MTRREEIAKASICQYQIIGTIGEQETFKNGFVKGAEWADKTMIEKACQWMESYLFDIGFPDDWCRDSTTMKSGKQRFLEAMEE